MKKSLAMTLLLLATSAAFAAPSSLDDRINLNLREADAAEVLASFEHVLSKQLDLDPAISGSLSIQLDNVSVRTTLNAICESVGCEWSLDGETLHFSAIAPPAAEADLTTLQFVPLNLDLKNAGAAEFFRSLAQILEADLELDPAVDGDFSIQLENADLDEILREVCSALGCETSLFVADGKRVLEVRRRN